MRKARKLPIFQNLCEFLKKGARIACNPVISNRVLKEEEPKGEDIERTTKNGKYSRRRNCFLTDLTELKHEDKACREICHLCKGSHSIDACENFLKMPLPDRRQLVQSRGLGHGCLKWGHIRKDCQHKKTCITCNGPHPTSLHDESRSEKGQGTSKGIPQATSHHVEARNTKNHNDCYSHSQIVPVWVHHENNPHDRILVYALLDDQSDACFIKVHLTP